MPRSANLSSQLGQPKQSTGGRSLIVLCIVSVLLLTFYLREGGSGPIHSVRSAVMTVTSPLRLIGSTVARPFAAVGGAVGDASASKETLSELEKENESLKNQVATLTEAQKTADRLQSLVGLQSQFSLKSTAARIIGTTGDAWSDTVTIDKGSSSGFAPGMPVCGAGGVIGQIIECAAATSTVRLITDEESGISAMVQESRAQGTVQGQADGTLLMEYVPTDADVKEGDTVITSGLGGSFPKGLPIGTVSSATKDANAVYYTIVVSPLSQAEFDEEILVVTSIGSDQVASDEEVAQANQSPAGSGREDVQKQESDGSSDSSDSDQADQGTDGTTGGE